MELVVPVVDELTISTAVCFSDKHLHLIILPTEKCNFRCTYCYETYKVGKIGSGVIHALKAFLKNRIPTLSSLTISWFGGEPLLTFYEITNISNYIKKVITLRNPNICYNSNITTNGYLLTAERFRVLYELGIKEYQISLDGSSEYHNRTRVLANGAPTFEVIMSNLNAIHLLKGDFSIILRIHMHHGNKNSLDELIKIISKNFAGDSRFKCFLKTIHNLKGEKNSDLSILSKSEEETLFRTLSKKIEEANLLMFNLSSNYICYASAANSFAIRPNGIIVKCTVALYEEFNNIGQLLSNGTLKVDNEKMQPWLYGLLTGDNEVKSCPLKYVKRTAHS